MGIPLSDNENPAVDDRLSGGLVFEEVKHLLSKLLTTGRIAGMSVTIFNPKPGTNNEIAKKISGYCTAAFS
ncbi:MAG: hypothetical protein ABI707_02410 [Ferruginibacter sp.]